MNRLIVVSNRVPMPDVKGQQAGGLAVALDPLMAKRGGVWFGWSGAVSDEAASRRTHIEQHGATEYATIDLTPDEHTRYYGNFANGVLWPLMHTMPELMTFDRRDAQVYRSVNARFAERLAPLIRPNDLIWVHDYHLMGLPALLRARHVRNPIGFFLHIPFPAPDVLATVPEAAGLVRDLMHADLLGFQTERDLDNFVSAAQTFAGAGGVEDGVLRGAGHRVRLGVFPAEIDAEEFAATAEASAGTEESEQFRTSIAGQSMILGVDRLDPSKGLLQRVAGYRRLLETREGWLGRTTFVQIAAVSRQDVAAYRDLRTALDREAGAINSTFGTVDWTPLRVVARALPRTSVAGFMRAATVGLVTPVRDGMNLVAKEFVAAQDRADPGVLVLSRFAGAAQQLDAALMVNPHDPDDMADMLDRALKMPLTERVQRWSSLWDTVRATSPVGWGRGFLAALLRTSLNEPQQRLRIPRASESVPALPRGPLVAARPATRAIN